MAAVSDDNDMFAFLPPIPLLGGYNALDLWPLTNLCMLSWIPLLLAPRWKYTPSISLVGPLILALVYTLLFASLLFLVEKPEGMQPPDMTTLQGVMTIFRDPTSALGGWVHYCVHDPLVGRWVALDSVQRGATTKFHIVVMIPVLVITLLVSPAGWLMYVAIVRPIFLPLPTTTKNNNDNNNKVKHN